MSVLSDIGDAVVSTISGASLSLTPSTVQRVYVPLYGEQEQTLKVFVVGATEKPDLYGSNATRSQCEHDYQVWIAIYKRVVAGDATSTTAVSELDGLSDYREEVLDLLKANRSQAGATLMEVLNAPVYDPAELDTKGVSVSMITATYRFLK